MSCLQNSSLTRTSHVIVTEKREENNTDYQKLKTERTDWVIQSESQSMVWIVNRLLNPLQRRDSRRSLRKRVHRLPSFRMLFCDTDHIIAILAWSARYKLSVIQIFSKRLSASWMIQFISWIYRNRFATLKWTDSQWFIHKTNTDLLVLFLNSLQTNTSHSNFNMLCMYYFCLPDKRYCPSCFLELQHLIWVIFTTKSLFLFWCLMFLPLVAFQTLHFMAI